MSSLQAKISLTFDQPISFYVLVMGGWYPLALVPNCVLALDKSTLNILHHLDSQSKRQDLEKNKWRLKYIDNESVILNPVLCALEGDNRAAPTKEEFTTKFHEAIERIRKHLPKAKIIEYSDASF
ncbi:hypothetical protein [Thiolapillus brandeum]|uniref:hypothetical protein n=1 Tax=Thiolapillus brandeum TaxID=1076588 RepID=UPI001184EFDC|nr:hypothetical protein [Thiolapillus brandeum]